MSDPSPSPRDDSRPALPSVDADGLTNNLFRLEHPTRTQRAWDRSRRAVTQGLRSLLQLLRRMFSRRRGGGGGGGYEQLPDPAPRPEQQQLGRPGQEASRDPEKKAEKEPSPLDRFIQMIRDLPDDKREIFEDAVLEKVRTDKKWERAYEEDILKSGGSFLMEFAHNAYQRERDRLAEPDTAQSKLSVDDVARQTAEQQKTNSLEEAAGKSESSAPEQSREYGRFERPKQDSQDLTGVGEIFMSPDGQDTSSSELGRDAGNLDAWDRYLTSGQPQSTQGPGAWDRFLPTEQPQGAQSHMRNNPFFPLADGGGSAHATASLPVNPLGPQPDLLPPDMASRDQRHSDAHTPTKPVHSTGSTDLKPATRGKR